jgi:acyl-CoA reductase-like NAD-dependent aldehyde dehydrogenase
VETTASSELAYRGGNFINGEERPSLAGGTFFSYDPLTGRPWGQFALADRDDVDLALRSGQAAFDGEWQRMSPATRGRALIRWGELILEHKDRLASLDSAQNGKLLSEVRAQARSARDCLFFFGGLVDKIQGAVIPLETSSVLNYTLYEPLGVVATIVPWNGPIFLTIMSVSPALAAGNSVLIKPSEVSSASAVELAKLAIEAGMPAGAVNVVTGDRTTGEAVVEHPFVRKIIFTGGDAAGRAIAARAGERLIGVTLELGGKSPNIVFADAPFEKAVAGILGGIFAGAGQGCIAGSRIYIQNSFYEEFLGRLIERCAAIRLAARSNPGRR